MRISPRFGPLLLLHCSNFTLRCCVRCAVLCCTGSGCLALMRWLQHESVFRADETYTLIQRLAHNVIKTGLRKINSSYSRISLQDLCEKVNTYGRGMRCIGRVLGSFRLNLSLVDRLHTCPWLWCRSCWGGACVFSQASVYIVSMERWAFERLLRFKLRRYVYAVPGMRVFPDHM